MAQISPGGLCRFVCAFAVTLLIPLQLPQAQLLSAVPRRGQAAQARSEEELDAYIKIVVATDSQQIVEQARTFLSQFPKSELSRRVYDYQLHASSELGDLPGVIAAGDKILAIDPNDINTMIAMAKIIANKAGKTQNKTDLLMRADKYCRQVLASVETARAPRTMTIEAFEAEKQSIRHQAHQTLGVIAIEQGKPKVAVSEFQTAIALAPIPEGSDYFRLGVALQATGAHVEAVKAFRDANKLGPASVSQLALTELRKQRLQQSNSPHR